MLMMVKLQPVKVRRRFDDGEPLGLRGLQLELGLLVFGFANSTFGYGLREGIGRGYPSASFLNVQDVIGVGSLNARSMT